MIMKKRSILFYSVIYVALLGMNLNCLAGQPDSSQGAVSGQQSETLVKKSAYSRFTQWLGSKYDATRDDIKLIWDYANKKVRGEKISDAEELMALLVAVRYGMSLVAIGGTTVALQRKFFMPVSKALPLAVASWTAIEITQRALEIFYSQLKRAYKATRADALILWSYSKKRMRGDKVTEQETQRAKRIAAKLGVSLVVIGAIFMAAGDKWRTQRRDRLVNELYRAVNRGDTNAVEALLQQGANPDLFIDTIWYTPLARAVLNDDLRMVLLLLKYGADVNAVGGYGVSPVELAVRERNRALIDALLQRGASRQAALIEAIYSDDNDLIEWLTEKKGAQVDTNVMIVAAAYGNRLADQIQGIMDVDTSKQMLANALGSQRKQEEALKKILPHIHDQVLEEEATFLQPQELAGLYGENARALVRREYARRKMTPFLFATEESKRLPKLPGEVKGKIFEFIAEQELSEKQRQKLMERSAAGTGAEATGHGASELGE